jgi:hypothetical protein
MRGAAGSQQATRRESSDEQVMQVRLRHNYETPRLTDTFRAET